MLKLVIGPTGAGKSTYIEKFFYNKYKVYFAYELKNRNIPEEGIVHYNMLYGADVLDVECFDMGWTPLNENVLIKIIESGYVDEVIVVVTPIEELKSRTKSRKIIEPISNSVGEYPAEKWGSIIDKVDMYKIYEDIFEYFEQNKLKVSVIYSSQKYLFEKEPAFLSSDRVFVSRNLRGDFVEVPDIEIVNQFILKPELEYQSVKLPHGLATKAGKYDHVTDGRAQSFAAIADRSCIGRSILDVGCALGDMLFRFERLGAERLIGVEKKESRYMAALELSKLLKSDIKLYNKDFLEIEFEQKFQDVLLLNVIHHISDFRLFIGKAVLLAEERLIIEYPTFADKKFQSINPVSGIADDMPVIGVSSTKVDQTFVYTKSALVALVADFGEFAHRLISSPIEGRQILIFERK